MAYQQQGNSFGRDPANPFGSNHGHAHLAQTHEGAPGYSQGGGAYESGDSDEYREQYTSEEDARRGACRLLSLAFPWDPLRRIAWLAVTRSSKLGRR